MEKLLKRDIEPMVKTALEKQGKVVIIYGPRQVGKTTLAKSILKEYGSEDGFFNCEELAVRSALQSENSDTMYRFLGGHEIVVLDEAQTVPNIGRALKILIDAHPEMHIIATGSSSFDLANKINEPLTGRHLEFLLLPLSFKEIQTNFGAAYLDKNLENLMIYGGYPEVVMADTEYDKREILKSLATSYLYKDVLMFNNIKNSEVLTKILQALALQVGGEVSYNELAGLIGVDRKTIISYIGLLEQCFVIYRRLPYMKNQRNEIKKMPKFYFYDNGILNSLVNNFSSLELRDAGPLWENIMMIEREKYNQRERNYLSSYYWRLKTGAEVDLVEEYNGDMFPYEFKFKKDNLSSSAAAFEKLYGKTPEVVNRQSFAGFVGISE